MDVFTPYCLTTTGYLTLQSLPLLLTPSLVVSLLSRDPRRPTDLETYLCRAFGLALLSWAATLLPLTGLLPTTSSAETDDKNANPYAYPTLITTTVYHLLNAFYLYTQLTYTWSFAFTAGLTLSSVLFCFGLWVLMFGGEKGRLSKTGADKRTGNFPFVNSESSKEKKKEAKASGSSSSSSGRRSMARTKSKD